MGDNRTSPTMVRGRGCINERRLLSLGNSGTPQVPNVNVKSAAQRPSNTPSSGLSQQVTTSAALSSRIGQRMRWTKEMNINVMRAYFRANNL